MDNAVIYARYSSRGQNEQTIDGQIRVCKEYALAHKLNIINTYVDKGKTGTDVNRPEFQKMIKDAEDHQFKFIIVYRLDRFCRNRYYSTIYTWRLSQNGVEILSATENITQDESGEFYRMFLEWNNEQYSKRLSRQVKNGFTTSVGKGTFTGGHMLYGYTVDKNTNKIQIKDDEADAVKILFNNYAAGITKKEIAKELNNKGYRFRGNLFKSRSFEHLLNNPKYTGKFLFGGRLCTNTYPQIIDNELFEKVQAKLLKNKKNSGTMTAKEPYLLTGKLFCGHCGEKMVAGGGTSKTGKYYPVYVCKNKKLHKCKKFNEKKDFIEWYITEQTHNFLSNPEHIEIISNDIINFFKNNIANKKKLQYVTNNLTSAKKEKEKIFNKLLNFDSSNPEEKILEDSFKKKYIEQCKLVEDLENHKEQILAQRKLNLDVEKIKTFFIEFLKGELHDKDFQKRLISNVVNCVYLYDDKITIYFNITGGGQENSYIGYDEHEEALVEENNSQNSNKCSNVTTSSPTNNFVSDT